MQFFGAILTAFFAQNLILQGHDLRDGVHLGNRHYPHRFYFLILYVVESLIISAIGILISRFGKGREILTYLSFFIYRLAAAFLTGIFTLIFKKFVPQLERDRHEDWIERSCRTALIAVGAVYKDDPYVNDLAKSSMTLGGICMGASVPFLIAALLPTKTKVNFTGLYNIYIYDTETKSLIRKEAVSVNCEETFKGSYTYDESSKEIVRDYVSQNVYNALLKKYDELSTWLEKR